MLALFSFPRPPPTQLYPLSLQDALPILQLTQRFLDAGPGRPGRILVGPRAPAPDGDLGPCGGVDLDLSPGKPMEPLGAAPALVQPAGVESAQIHPARGDRGASFVREGNLYAVLTGGGDAHPQGARRCLHRLDHEVAPGEGNAGLLGGGDEEGEVHAGVQQRRMDRKALPSPLLLGGRLDFAEELLATAPDRAQAGEGRAIVKAVLTEALIEV